MATNQDPTTTVITGTIAITPWAGKVSETGHWLGLQLREGSVHTANGASELLLPLIDKARDEIADQVYVRGDAGFPSGAFLDQLDGKGVRYAFRLKATPGLREWAEVHAVRPPGRPTQDPRTWCYDVSYQADSWGKARRVVLVVQEKPDELYLHSFFIVTSFTKEEMSADAVLDFYRERALMENHIGEHQSVLQGRLASTNRQKNHIQGKEIGEHAEPINAQGVNFAALFLHGIAYNLAGTLRCIMGKAIEIEGSGGMHFKTVRRIFLAIAGRFVISGRRATLRVSTALMKHWTELWDALARIPHQAAA